MSSLGLAVVFYIFILVWSFVIILRFKATVTESIRMVSPMVVGMIVGFGGGTLSGLYIAGPVQSLVLGVLLGIFSGSIIGGLMGLGAFLNGASSGMMAGLMGVMLIQMFPQSEWKDVLFFFMVVSGFLQFAHTLLLQRLSRENVIEGTFKVLSSPLFMFLFISTVLMVYVTVANHNDPEQAKPLGLQKTIQNTNHTNH